MEKSYKVKLQELSHYKSSASKLSQWVIHGYVIVTVAIIIIDEQLQAKDNELEKYKKYLNKAKKVCVCVWCCQGIIIIITQIIEGFGDRKVDPAVESAEIQQLRSLLQEREKEIERLEVCM